MKRGPVSEIWTTRNATDKARHSSACIVCREGLRPYGDQKLYGVKNARTREFVHVLVNGESLESKLGWPREEVLYSIMLEDGSRKGPPMPEETKRIEVKEKKLKEVNQLRRSLRRTPANTPARPAEGEIKEEAMAKKKLKKAVKVAETRRAGSSGKADAFLPAKFVRVHGGKDHVFERIGDGWKLDGDGPMPLRRAMAKLMGESAARATSFIRYFKADKIVAANKAVKKPVKKTVKETRGVAKEAEAVGEVVAEKVAREAV